MLFLNALLLLYTWLTLLTYCTMCNKRHETTFYNSHRNSRDTEGNKLNTTKMVLSTTWLGRTDGVKSVCGGARHRERRESARQQLWFPSISVLGGQPGQMALHSETYVKCYSRSPMVYLRILSWLCWFCPVTCGDLNGRSSAALTLFFWSPALL